MSFQEPTPIQLSSGERAVLETWSRRTGDDPRHAERARIVLMAAQGVPTRGIARAVGCTIGTASKWRVRFSRDRLDGLSDRPRPGARRRYDEETDRRILDLLAQPPPGRRTWTGALLAEALGDVSDQYIWRFLRSRGMRRDERTAWHWHVGTPFRGRTIDIVAMYLHPTESAILLASRVGPATEEGSRRGYLTLPRGAVLSGLTAAGRQENGLGLAAVLTAAASDPPLQGGPGQPTVLLDALIGEMAQSHADGQVMVLADRQNAGRRLSPWGHVHLHVLAGRSNWLAQLGLIFTLLVRTGADQLASLRARELTDAVGHFLERAEARSAPFVWRRDLPAEIP